MRLVTCFWWFAMDKVQGFESFLIERNDALDNAAHELALSLLITKDMPPNEDAFLWSMEIIGAILESTAAILKEHGHHTCWPYYGDNEMPCYALDDCKHQCCPLKQHQKEAMPNE